jgi:hypothetical protein
MCQIPSGRIIIFKIMTGDRESEEKSARQQINNKIPIGYSVGGAGRRKILCIIF